MARALGLVGIVGLSVLIADRVLCAARWLHKFPWLDFDCRALPIAASVNPAGFSTVEFNVLPASRA
jgi:hypothetical protein